MHMQTAAAIPVTVSLSPDDSGSECIGSTSESNRMKISVLQKSAKEEKLKPIGEATNSNNCKTYAGKSVAAPTAGDNDPVSHAGRPMNVCYMVKG